MTPDGLARIHARAMVVPRPWSAETFKGFLSAPGSVLAVSGPSFALGRVIADEAELLTLAVDPVFQRQGIGRLLTLAWLDSIADNAQSAFLEVAADNVAARALYASFGFAEVAKRSAYYARKNAAAADAIVMRRDLT